MNKSWESTPDVQGTSVQNLKRGKAKCIEISWSCSIDRLIIHPFVTWTFGCIFWLITTKVKRHSSPNNYKSKLCIQPMGDLPIQFNIHWNLILTQPTAIQNYSASVQLVPVIWAHLCQESKFIQELAATVTGLLLFFCHATRNIICYLKADHAYGFCRLFAFAYNSNKESLLPTSFCTSANWILMYFTETVIVRQYVKMVCINLTKMCCTETTVRVISLLDKFLGCREN